MGENAVLLSALLQIGVFVLSFLSSAHQASASRSAA